MNKGVLTSAHFFKHHLYFRGAVKSSGSSQSQMIVVFAESYLPFAWTIVVLELQSVLQTRLKRNAMTFASWRDLRHTFSKTASSFLRPFDSVCMHKRETNQRRSKVIGTNSKHRQQYLGPVCEECGRLYFSFLVLQARKLTTTQPSRLSCNGLEDILQFTDWNRHTAYCHPVEILDPCPSRCPVVVAMPGFPPGHCQIHLMVIWHLPKALR